MSLKDSTFNGAYTWIWLKHVFRILDPNIDTEVQDVMFTIPLSPLLEPAYEIESLSFQHDVRQYPSVRIWFEYPHLRNSYKDIITLLGTGNIGHSLVDVLHGLVKDLTWSLHKVIARDKCFNTDHISVNRIIILRGSGGARDCKIYLGSDQPLLELIDLADASFNLINRSFVDAMREHFRDRVAKSHDCSLRI